MAPPPRQNFKLTPSLQFPPQFTPTLHTLNITSFYKNESWSTLGVVDSEMTGKHRANLASDTQPPVIAEDLYSHQIAVYGAEAVRRLIDSNILISGMQGLGAEIAKNLILSGVKSVTLHDEGTVEMWDLSGNFIFSEEDLGKNRAGASVPKLQQINNSVRISTLTTEVTKEHLSDFQAAVFTDISLEKAIEFDDYCHQHHPRIAFIKSEIRGLFGSVYCDFGPDFIVLDKEPHPGFIASISNDNPALITCVDGKTLEFRDGDLVMFSEVRGMTELNNGKPRKIISASAYTFTIEEDTTSYAMYERGGIVTEVNEFKVLNFKPLRQALKDPGDFLRLESSKYNSPPLMHLAFQALDKFKVELRRFPFAGSEKDAQRFIALLNGINNDLGDRSLEKIDQKLLRNFASGAGAVLIPMATMFGGIVGQEVVKACSRKFHPLFQFFYFDSVESLPSESLDSDDLKPMNCRYDAQISVFGSNMQKKLEEAKVFVVGSGASGCEFLKNVALMGVCCGEIGKLTITDNEVIAKSDLSRQFMFRDSDIGQAKSTVAASAASLINQHLRVESSQNRVDHETENVFDDTFWENLNVVINGVGDENSMLYINQRCLYFQKALLVSGTSGTKCRTQMVIPHLTDDYDFGASMDPYENHAPFYTWHFYPYKIDHCLAWARTELWGSLEQTPTEINAYLSDPSEYIFDMRSAGDAQARNKLEWVLECLDKNKCDNFQDCVTWARLKFEDYFVNRIKCLTENFPEDAVTSSGAPFWSAPKRFPHPLQFSNDDLSHLNFVMAASILRAQTFGIRIPDWAMCLKNLTDAVDKVVVPEFLPWEIVTDKEDSSPSIETIDESTVINRLAIKLEMCRKKLPPNYKMNPIKLEKDDMDLIAGLANMRAKNYDIPEVDNLKAKFITWGIIPEIITSTSVAIGLVCLELYKLLDGNHKLDDYRNAFVNLSIPLFSMSKPIPCTVIKHQDIRWTIWDRWILKGNPTLRELIQWLENKGLSASRISIATELHIIEIPIQEEIMDKKLVHLYESLSKSVLPRYKRQFDVLVVSGDIEEEDGVNIPMISIYFK